MTIAKTLPIILDMETTTGQVLDTPRSLRARVGLGQNDLANRSHVSARTISEIDAGRDVRSASIRRVARVLDVSSGHLLDAMDRERMLRKRMNMDRALSARSSEFKGGGSR